MGRHAPGEFRFPVDAPVEVRGERRSVEGRVTDINEKGLHIKLQMRVSENERLGLTLRIPGFANEDLVFVAEVRTVIDRAPDFEAGCEFIHTDDSRKKLRLLLWELEKGNLREIEKHTGHGPGK